MNIMDLTEYRCTMCGESIWFQTIPGPIVVPGYWEHVLPTECPSPLDEKHRKHIEKK